VAGGVEAEELDDEVDDEVDVDDEVVDEVVAPASPPTSATSMQLLQVTGHPALITRLSHMLASTVQPNESAFPLHVADALDEVEVDEEVEVEGVVGTSQVAHVTGHISSTRSNCPHKSLIAAQLSSSGDVQIAASATLMIAAAATKHTAASAGRSKRVVSRIMAVLRIVFRRR
jgi:hypothetical protein